jgi:hypothetical protein
VPERELAAAVRRHHPQGLSHAPADIVDRLTDHFLRVRAARISWVHPSWRDLVIDELRDDADARERFLRACGLEGALLALSIAGGPAGERALPLFIEDRDWDALTDRLHRLVGDLAQAELTSLLGAIITALDSADSDRSRSELHALAERALALASKTVATAGKPVSVPLLRAWLTLAEAADWNDDPPNLARTWAELLPIPSTDLASTEELTRLDDWLALAQALARHRPSSLQELGFPERSKALIEKVVSGADDLAGSQGSVQHGLWLSILDRLVDVVPPHTGARAYAKRAVIATRGLELAPVMTVEPATESGPPPDDLLIDRILADL